MIWLRALAVWLLIVVVESIHGTVRRLFVEPLLGETTARRVAFFTGMFLILIVCLLTIRWIEARSPVQLLMIGLMWAALMLVFEIGLGAALGYTRDRILEDYDPARGGLMGFGIVFLGIVPWLTARLRGIKLLNEQS